MAYRVELVAVLIFFCTHGWFDVGGYHGDISGLGLDGSLDIFGCFDRHINTLTFLLQIRSSIV